MGSPYAICPKHGVRVYAHPSPEITSICLLCAEEGYAIAQGTLESLDAESARGYQGRLRPDLSAAIPLSQLHITKGYPEPSSIGHKISWDDPPGDPLEVLEEVLEFVPKQARPRGFRVYR